MTNADHGIDPGLIGVRLDADGQDRLELVVAEMQSTTPELTVDDCIDAIFAIGLISTFSTLTVMEAIREAAA